MSMLGIVRRVPAQELAGLIQDPIDIFWYLHGSEPQQPPRGLLARILGKQSPHRKEQWQAPPHGFQLELDKSWHCVHYLLAGDPWEGDLPSAYLLGGGIELGDVDVGYGPARALLPEHVAEFHQYLCGISEGDLRSRYDKEAMEKAEIYAALKSPDEIPYVWSYVQELRSLLGAAAAAGDGVIVYIY